MFKSLVVQITKHWWGNNNSNTFYAEDSNTNYFWGKGGNDTFFAGSGNDYFYGGSGVDTVNYSTSPGPVKVDLASGKGGNTFMDRGGTTDSVGDRYDSIENVRGSNFNDQIFGSSVNNVLKGGNGHDWIHGGSGNDTIDGGSDNDILFGGSGDDNLYGSSGNDRFFIEEGRDDYFGGTGYDKLIIGRENGITIDLEAGRGFGGDAEGDTYSSIEQIVFQHGASDVTVQGSWREEDFVVRDVVEGPIQINAGYGQDTVEIQLNDEQDFEEHADSFFDGGSGGGDDTLEIDTDQNLVVDVEDGEFFQQNNSRDEVNFQNFEGIVAGSGNDILIDAKDTDIAFKGGEGNDTFVFDHDGDRNTEADVIADFSSGEDRIDLDDTEVNNWADLLDTSDGDGMFDHNGGVMIRTADNNSGQFDTVFLEGVSVSELSQDDFIF